MPPPISPVRSWGTAPVLLALILLTLGLPAGPAAGQQTGVPSGPQASPPSSGTLGQVPADYELHGELMLISGQLTGFEQACGFGLKPNRKELLDWYAHYHLARSMARIEAIYELGVSIGRDGPCTVEHNDALVRQWRSLLNRTATYVEQYR